MEYGLAKKIAAWAHANREPNKQEDWIQFCMKRLRTLKLFQIFSTEIKKSKTCSGWCTFKGLSNGTTLMQIQSGQTVPLTVILFLIFVRIHIYGRKCLYCIPLVNLSPPLISCRLFRLPSSYILPRSLLPLILSSETVAFCDGIFKQSMGARNRVGIGLSYRHATTEAGGIVPWNRLLGSLKV